MGNYRLKKHATTTNLCWILKKLRSNEPYQNSAIVLFKQLKKTLYVYSLNHDDLQYPFQISKACEIIKEDAHYCHYVYILFCYKAQKEIFLLLLNNLTQYYVLVWKMYSCIHITWKNCVETVILAIYQLNINL